MTPKRKKLLWISAGSVAGLLAILVVASILIVQSAWFANFVRAKVISAAEESTGGVVEIGSFDFDWRHLTVRIRNFVLHGTEPARERPLLSASLLELHLKLLAGLKQAVDLQYLGIQQPRVNLIVFADGKTNIPEPKVKAQPSQKSGLETVVDLAVNRFEIENGQIAYAQQTTAFSADGENLRALLNYNLTDPGYQGALTIAPLLIASGGRAPLRVNVNLPVAIGKDSITLADGHLDTDRSQILVNAALRDLNAPVISGRVNANISLAEMQRSFDLPIQVNQSVPGFLTAEVSASLAQKSNVVQVQTAHLALGQTTFQASGSLDPAKNSVVQFNGNLALAELGRLFKIVSPKAAGDLQVNGSAALDANSSYAVNGTVNSRGLSLRNGDAQAANLNLYSPFHADPYLISLDGLRLDAFGGRLSAKIFIEKLRQLSVEGNLRSLSLSGLALALTGKPIGYSGNIDGTLLAKGDLKAKGTAGYSAAAHLVLSPGQRGVPLSGQVNARYTGANGIVDVGQSFINLPRSRIELAGPLNKEIVVKLVSRNLNDFLPAANYGSSALLRSLPVNLQGGTATLLAQIKGNLARPQIAAHLEANRLGTEQRAFDRVALDLAASNSGASIGNGVLTQGALRADLNTFIGLVNWKPLPRSPVTANLTLRNGDLADLLAIAGQSSITASGAASADIHINGTYGDPLGTAALQVAKGSFAGQPFDRASVNANLADRLITLSNLEVSAAGGRLNANGTFRHPRDSFLVGHADIHVATNNIDLANLVTLQRQNAGAAGQLTLTADASADIHEVNKTSEVSVSYIKADVTARGLRVQNQPAGDLTATARTEKGAVNYDVNSDFAGASIHVTGRTALVKNYPTTADAAIRNLPLDKTLQLAGQSTIPARGDLSADAHLAGTLDAPNAKLDFTLARANIYQEPIDKLQGRIRYSDALVDMSSLKLDMPAGSVSLSGSFAHARDNFSNGVLKLRIDSTDIQVAKIQHAQQIRPGLAGTLHLAADLSATLREKSGQTEFMLASLNADASAHDLSSDRRRLGDASLTAKTNGSNLDFKLESDLANSRIRGSGQAQLAADYPVRANLTFNNIRYANLAPFVSSEPSVKPTFDALVEGEASVSGPILNTSKLAAKLQLDRLDIRTNPQVSPTGAPPGRTVEFQNDGPIIVALDHSVIQVQQLVIQGPRTNITASGGFNLNNINSPLGLNLKANADLGVLQDIDRDFYSSGKLTIDARVRGNLTRPLVNGRVELQNANVNYAQAPNGLSNGNGVILLNGTNATIQKLTGESGGGDISLGGFVGFGTSVVNYNLRAAATKVRTRYSGISLTSSAALSLTGNSRRSLLAGNVTISRIAYSSSSDAGSILSTAAAPPATPEAPSPFLTSTRLDIHVVTAPDVRVVTSYAQRLDVSSNLSLRGTAAAPGMLGRVTVNNGQLVFFGNTYTVNTGTINFYNPNLIQPILDVSLETTAQGVDVLIGVSGPMSDLKLTYRSDPPLTFEQIVQLLATNTTPADPTVAAHQPAPAQQSLGQMGESALLGQAVANPLASRVQRVFGLSQFKIDPSFSGSNGQPSAKVTLQQNIASNITFTYITDVTQSNSEIVRVEWALTPKFSAVALRDFNGDVSVEFFYKFKVR